MKKIHTYSVGLSKILKARAGFTSELKDKILTQSKNYCDSLDNDLKVDAGWASAQTILKDFLDGKPFATGHDSAKHWYIVELLCNGLGKELPNNEWENSSVDDFYNYDEFRMYFLGTDALVRLPSPVSTPLVFTVENANLENAKLRIDRSSHSVDEKIQFLDWVQTTMDDDNDLIFFIY